MREGDEAGHLRAARALDDRAFVQLGIDPRERCQVDDRAETDPLPDARADVDRAKPARFGEIADRLAAQGGHQPVDHSVVGQQLLEHADDDHDGDEVREIGDGLHRALVAGRPHLVEQQCQQDRRPEPPDDGQEAQEHRIADEPPEERILEEQLEIVESHPGAAQYPGGEIVALERQQDAVHGQVAEKEHHDHADGGHQIEILLMPEIAGDPVEPGAALAPQDRRLRLRSWPIPTLAKGSGGSPLKRRSGGLLG